MCQLIEVTWFIWKLSADQIIVLLDREQCSISYFLAWEHRKTDNAVDNAHILDINVLINGNCQNRAPADQYYLTVSRAQVSTHQGQVFFEVIHWQVTSFQVIAGSNLFFVLNADEIYCVYVPHN